jgi:nifR3 family TIM-barrel protein
MKKDFWKKLKRPVMVAAPMSGVTDDAFRLMLVKYGKPDVFWTEFISAAALLSEKGRKYCLDTLKFAFDERPIVAQIFGSVPVEIEKACGVVAKLGFDGIDINMGCPDRDIEKQGAGAALIKNPDLAKEIIRSAKKGANGFPISVKTRIGYGKNQVSEWIPALLEENVSAITVHMRTRNELYMPPAHWELAKEIVKLRDRYAPQTLILGNGDVKTPDQAKKLSEETGLDGIMIGRSVLGNPWFFSDKIPSVLERLNAIVEHAEIFEENCKQFESLKKHFHAYAKGFNGAKELRENLMKVKDARETKEIIESFLKNML